MTVLVSHHHLLDSTTAAGEKVIGQPNDQADHPLEDTKTVDARHHEIARVRAPIPGYPQIEHMDVPAVAHPNIDAARERLPSRLEAMDQARTVGDGPLHDDFRLEETTASDRLLLPGGLDPLGITRVGRAICPEVAAAQDGPGIPLQEVKITDRPDKPLLLFPITIGRHKLSPQTPNRR